MEKEKEFTIAKQIRQNGSALFAGKKERHKGGTMNKITEGAAGKYKIVKYKRVEEENPEILTLNEAMKKQKDLLLGVTKSLSLPEYLYYIEPA